MAAVASDQILSSEFKDEFQSSLDFRPSRSLCSGKILIVLRLVDFYRGNGCPSPRSETYDVWASASAQATSIVCSLSHSGFSGTVFPTLPFVLSAEPVFQRWKEQRA